MSAAEAPEQLDYRLDHGVPVVDACGEIDVYSCGRLRDRLLAVIGDGHRGLVVNMRAVDFIDSAGVGVLVGVWHRLQAVDGVLALAAPSRQARTIFDVTGLAKAFSVCETEEQAVQACRQAGGG